MKSAKLHPKENERLAALEQLKILDTLPEKDFDDLTLIASQICDTPIALLSLVDETRQWFKSKQGIDASQTPREFAFCAHAILTDNLFIVSDSQKDERFNDNPLVTGSPKVAFYAGAPLLSPDGYPIGTLCVIDHEPRVLSDKQKITLTALSRQVSRLLDLRLQFEQQKIFSEKLEHKKIAIENLSEGVVVQNTNFQIVEFNAAALAVLGLTENQLIGKTSMDPDWRSIKEDGSPFPGTEHPAVLALKTGKIQKDVIMGIHRPSYELRWIKINSTPIFNSDKASPMHSVTSFSDITLEKNASLIVEKNKAHLERVLNSVPAMIGHWDNNLINLNANIAYSKYFGKSPDEIIGKSIQELLGKEIFELNYPYMLKALQGENQIFERMLPLPDGSIRHVLANYLPEHDNGKVVGFFVIVTDITEVKHLENERQLMAAKMIESAKLSSLGEMAGGVAHEINTPLAIITGKASLLLEEYKNGTATETSSVKQIEKIKLTAERIAKIIKGLRQFSRNSNGDPVESFSVLSVVDATLDLCQEKLAFSEIKLIKNIDEGFLISGKFVEISQVVMNLISNSIDAVSLLSEKWIKLEASQNGHHCRITVTDSGSGIAADIAQKIMNPFYTTKEVGKGTGLGLSISSGIVNSQGGKLWYDQTCQNTSFIIELPIQEGALKETIG